MKTIATHVAAPRRVRMTWWDDFKECLENNDNEKLIKLLKRVSVNVCDRQKESLLHHAVKSNSTFLVDYLIEHGCNANIKNLDEKTPLHCAAENGNAVMVDVLINKSAKCNVDARDAKGHTPVVYAIENNRVDVVKMLIQAGTDINLPTDRGCGLLHIAAKNLNFEIIQLLLDAGCDVTSVSTYGNTALLILVCKFTTMSKQHYESIEKLIQAGADVNASNHNQIRGWGGSVLHYAAEEDTSFSVAPLLLSKGAQIDQVGSLERIPLQWAVMRSNFSAIKGLVEAGSNVNWPDYRNDTCLHMAMRRGNPEIVQFLLDNGASVLYADDDDLDPFSFGIQEWSLVTYGIIEHLDTDEQVDYDDVVESRLKTPNSCLPEIRNQLKCLKILLKKGVNINRTTMDLDTPLTIALEQLVHSNVISFLLRHGAYVDFSHEVVCDALEDLYENSKIPFLLIAHAALCQAQNLTDKSRNFDIGRLNNTLQKYYRDCRDELEEMKKWMIHSKFSLYDLLVQKNVAKYVRNEKTVEMLEKVRLLKRFPTYIDQLNRRFKKEEKKQRRLDAARDGLCRLLKWNANSFAVIYDNILRFLPKGDLITLSLM